MGFHLVWFCEGEIVHREEAEADVTASCYDCQISIVLH